MTPNSPCPDRDTLTSLLLGEVSEADMEGLEGHVSHCPRCLEVVRALETEDALVKAVRSAGKTEDFSQVAFDPDWVARLCRLSPKEIGTPLPGDTPSVGTVAAEEAADVAGLLSPPQGPGELGRIGPYSIQRVLGRGGMGIVFAAWQTRPQRLVALKMILAGRHLDRQRLERFRNESEIVAQLRHPNIVQVYEVGEHDGRPYFTMEYADGGSLAQKLATALLAPRAAAELILALAGAMSSAHMGGFIHRDLKPSNVLLDGDGTARISDFGLAKQLQVEGGAVPAGQTETGAILGTPNYMAPEQAGNSKNIGPAADVYALGAILYECLTGRPPFRAATVLETLDQLRTQDAVPPSRLQPGVPRDLQTICLKCLAKEPARRYASARDLADDLRRFLDGEPIRARAVPLRERLWKWACRRPALATTTALSVVFLAAFVAAILVYNARLQATTRAAVAEKERADAGYRKARDTLNKMLDRLAEKGVDSVPQIQELYRAQMEDALEFYLARLADQDSLDPSVRMDIARACHKAAVIQGNLGRTEEALQNFQRAIDFLDGLPPAAPGVEEKDRLSHLGKCCSDRGLLAFRAQRWEEAERSQRRALEIEEHLAKLEPAAVEWKQNVARCEHYLGALFQNQDRRAEAETHYQRCLAIHQELLRDYPDLPSPGLQTVQTKINLALLYQFTDRSNQVGTMYEEVEAVLGAEAAKHPPATKYPLLLTTFYVNWGVFLRGRAEHAAARGNQSDFVAFSTAALAKQDRGVELAEVALRQEPRHHEARKNGYIAHGARAQTYQLLKRYAEAIPDWDRVVALDESPAQWMTRTCRALDLARAGDHVRGCTEADALARVPDVGWDGLCYLVRAYAIGVRSVQAGPSTAQERAVAQSYARRAIRLLQKLHAQKIFEDDGAAKWLRTEADLSAIRDREDFRRLMADVDQHKQP